MSPSQTEVVKQAEPPSGNQEYGSETKHNKTFAYGPIKSFKIFNTPLQGSHEG